jgi:hypothetical protein
MRIPDWFKAMVAATFALLVVNFYIFLRIPSRPTAPVFAVFTGEKLIGALGTLAATFIGAWLAFRFAKSARDQTKADDNVTAGNLALFTLTTMWNQTRQHQKEVVVEYRNRADAWLNLPVSNPLNEKLAFELKDLAFVAERAPNAFASLLMEQERFRLAAYMVEEHRRVALDQAWPKLAAAGISMNEAKPEDHVEDVLGPGITRQLKVITAGIINNFDENEASLKKAFVELRSALVKCYPERKFINFKFDSDADDTRERPVKVA